MTIRTRFFTGGLAALVLLGAVVLAPVQAFAVTNQSIAVPLFGRPGSGTFWDDVRSMGSSSVPFIVANPGNGPGLATDPVYASAIAANTAAKIRTLGYVQTNYQTRTFRDTLNDVDAWYRLYPQTGGVYLDLIKEGGQDEACYAAALYSHIKNVRPNDLVVLAPGGHISPAYEPYADIFVNANADYASYKAWRPQHRGFEDKASYQNRFWHIVYSVSGSEYDSAFADIRSNNAGWLYMTDKTAPTPFTSTPSFWQNEANDISALPESVVPNRGKTSLPRGCISLSSSADNTVDTRAAKQSMTLSTVTVNNTSAGYDSEPATGLQLMSLPQGVTPTKLEAQGWTCDVLSKNCGYPAVIPASSSPPKITAGLSADCNYAGGDAILRLTNYAGNRWDLKLPMRAPFGCDPGTPAGKLNTDKSGLVQTLTTQSNETTPEIIPLGVDTSISQDQTPDETKKGTPVIKTVAIVLAAIILLSLAAWGGWLLHKRRRYSVRL